MEWCTCSAPQFYTDLQDAIDAIVVDAGGAPSYSDNYQIILFPGHYSRTGGYTLASNINVEGPQATSVFIDSLVTWNPGSGVNSNRLAEVEQVHFKSVTFTAGITETVNPAKLLANPTNHTWTNCEMRGGDYTFTMRPSASADHTTAFNLLSVNSGMLQFNTGGNINFYQSFLFNSQPIRLVGDPTSANMYFSCDDNEIASDIIATDVNFILTGGVIAGAWSVGGHSLLEMTNCGCDKAWTLLLAGSSHADIWSSPHNNIPSNDAVTCTDSATLHRDVTNFQVVMPALATSIVVPLQPMQNSDYNVQLTPGGNRILYCSSKLNDSFVLSGTADVIDSLTNIQVSRELANLSLV